MEANSLVPDRKNSWPYFQPPLTIMHARHLAEIAAWIATQAQEITQAMTHDAHLLADTYWVASKARCLRWSTALKTFESDLNVEPPTHNPWPALETIIEEILVTETLTRIWGAILVSTDTTRGTRDYSPLAHSVFISHMELRNRVLRILLRSRGQHELLFEKTNQLRNAIEKWTDLFLAKLPVFEAAKAFAFDAKRFEDFYREQMGERERDMKSRNQILTASFQQSMQKQCKPWSANPELNRRVVEGIAACIDETLFEPEQLPTILLPLWSERAHSRTEMLVAQLSQLDA